MKLHIGQVLIILAAVVSILQRDGLMDAKGNFQSPISPEAVARAAADIEKLLKSFGLEVDGNVDKIIQALPILLPLAGVK